MTQLLTPASVEEAAGTVAASLDAVVLAGGTLLVPAWTADGWPAVVVSLRRAGLAWADASGCGAAATIGTLAVTTGAPAALCEAAAGIGGPALRNTATVGGNVLGGGPQCLRVALLALGAVAHVRRGRALEIVALDELSPTLPGALLARLEWPTEVRASAFAKLGVRRVGGPFYAAVAAARVGARLRLAVGSTGVAPHRLLEAEARWEDIVGGASSEVVADAAAKTATRTVVVAADAFAPADYRREAVGALVRRLLRSDPLRGVA